MPEYVNNTNISGTRYLATMIIRCNRYQVSRRKKNRDRMRRKEMK